MNDFDRLNYLIDCPESKEYMHWILREEEKDLELFLYWLQLFDITEEQKKCVINGIRGVR